MQLGLEVVKLVGIEDEKDLELVVREICFAFDVKKESPRKALGNPVNQFPKLLGVETRNDAGKRNDCVGLLILFYQWGILVSFFVFIFAFLDF